MTARRCAYCGHLHRHDPLAFRDGVQPRCHVFACECKHYAPHVKRPLDGPIIRTRRLRDTRDTTTKRGGSLMGVTRATGPRA